MQGVFDAGLLFLHFDFGGGTDLDEGHAAGELGNAFLKLFTVVVARGGFDLRADVPDAVFDGFGLAGAVDDRRVFLRDFNLLGRAKLFERGLVEREADVGRDDRAAGQDGDVLEHGSATVAEARGLDGHDLEDAADGVHDEGGEGFTVDVFSDDDERTGGLGDLFEHGEKFADVADLLVVQEDERVVENGGLLFRLVDEVRGEVAAVELHAFDDFEFVLEGLAVFNRDHAFLAHLVHGFGDDVADFSVGVGGDGADLGDFLVGRRRLADLAELFDGGGDGLVDAALEIHRVHAGGNELHAFVNDGLGENRGGRRAVAGVVARLGGDFTHHAGAHVFELVLEFDFLGDGHAVFRHRRSAEGAVEHDVAALRTERDLDGVGENIDAADHLGAGVITEKNLLSSHFCNPLLS